MDKLENINGEDKCDIIKCRKCGNYKSVDKFAWKYKDKGIKDTICKVCKKEYGKQYYKDNKEKSKEYYKEYYKDNKEHYKKVNKEWRLNNPDKVLINWTKRMECIRNNTPELTKDEIQRIKELSNLRVTLIKLTGIEFDMDHIRPVKEGGGSEPDNLQLLPAELNGSKGFKWPPSSYPKEWHKYTGITIDDTGNMCNLDRFLTPEQIKELFEPPIEM